MPLVSPGANKAWPKPSSLAAVIVQVRDAFDLMKEFPPGMVMCGKAYKEQRGPGSSPRVLFIPDAGRGSLEGPYQMGESGARVNHTCEVRVRGKESGDDFERLSDAYALADLVIDCVSVAGSGRLEWGDYYEDSPTDNDAGYGVEIVFTFTYKRDVWHDERRWSLDPADIDGEDPLPHPPPGTIADGIIIDPISTTPIDSDGGGPGP